jgi:hypothetical protein
MSHVINLHREEFLRGVEELVTGALGNSTIESI